MEEKKGHRRCRCGRHPQAGVAHTRGEQVGRRWGKGVRFAVQLLKRVMENPESFLWGRFGRAE